MPGWGFLRGTLLELRAKIPPGGEKQELEARHIPGASVLHGAKLLILPPQ